jgi:hypothetical protein
VAVERWKTTGRSASLGDEAEKVRMADGGHKIKEDLKAAVSSRRDLSRFAALDIVDRAAPISGLSPEFLASICRRRNPAPF